MLKVEKKPNSAVYTTGACAAAAAKGAADMIINGEIKDEAVLMLPACMRVRFRLTDQAMNSTAARCAVVKKWNGIEELAGESILIYAKATKTSKARDIVINYKKGIGRYNKKVGSIKEGEAAVSEDVKFLIKNAVLDLWEGKKINYGLLIEIAIPKGAEVAKKTVNEAYGIMGGMALIGAYGINVKDTPQDRMDKTFFSMKKAKMMGATKLIFTQSSKIAFLNEEISFNTDENLAAAYRDLIADALELAERIDIEEILFVNSISEACAFTMGIESTALSVQAPVLVAHAAKFGMKEDIAAKMLKTQSTEELVKILSTQGILDVTLASVIDAALENIRGKVPQLNCEMMVVLKDCVIASSSGACEMKERINNQTLHPVELGDICMQEGEGWDLK